MHVFQYVSVNFLSRTGYFEVEQVDLGGCVVVVLKTLQESS